MLSIGELAQRTGVSRRMLRHWEESGLLTPAHVDARPGRRQYEQRQAGRVQAIARLRAVGFGLDAIQDLLASELTEARLVTILKKRELKLREQASETSTRLAEVRTRLASIEKGHDIIAKTLSLARLPAVTVIGAQETVADESEIGGAVARLLALLSESAQDDHDIALVYDGTTDDTVITVTAGTLTSPGSDHANDSSRIVIAGSDHGATVSCPEMPTNVGDMWIAIDAELEQQELRTTGPFRQINHNDGSVTFQAKVLTLDGCA